MLANQCLQFPFHSYYKPGEQVESILGKHVALTYVTQESVGWQIVQQCQKGMELLNTNSLSNWTCFALVN